MSQHAKQKFYVATAIAYTSKKPHIGNTYEIVLADAMARFYRLLGFDTYFLTGTDEHGQKIEASAKQAGTTPQKYVDGVAGEVRAIWDLMNTSYDQFIRTTHEKHQKIVQRIFKKLYDQGDIYKGFYEGLYCTPCESFWTEGQLVDSCCPDCGRVVSKTKEEAYFFKMSHYQDRLIKHIKENPTFILPEARKAEMINNFLTPGLQDLCVSRTSFSWGIPVEFDPKHVVYVWLDALTNYISALGYDPDGSSELFERYWPCDVHVIGKDILRFHSIYWPIILMALGLELPRQIFAHPWLLSGEDKMSKSRGNVLYADDLVRHFGVDGVRYYLLKEMPYLSDGSISYQQMILKYNSDLANTLGNLCHRTISMTHKYFSGCVKNHSIADATDQALQQTVLESVEQFTHWMKQHKLSEAIEVLIQMARCGNKYIDDTMPWNMAKEESQLKHLQTVLYNLLESVRFIGVLLSPILPETSQKMLAQLGTKQYDFASLSQFGALEECELAASTPLFARIDPKEKLQEIEAELAAVTTQSDATNEKAVVPANDTKQERSATEPISIEQFFSVSLKAAKVLSCEPVKKSDKLLCLTLDDGSATPRQVVSGIAQWYKPTDLVGKTIAIVANLKPVKLRGVESNGMILCADLPDGGASVILLEESVPAGAVVR